jgi:flagellar biosynthetic protein FliP
MNRKRYLKRFMTPQRIFQKVEDLKVKGLFVILGAILVPLPMITAGAEEVLPTAPFSSLQSTFHALQSSHSFNLHDQLRILGFFALLSLLPFGVIMMTSFTRLTIIFHFLRHALGTLQVPSTQIIVGLSLILTGFIMHPVIEKIHTDAFLPYLNNTLKDQPEVRMGIKGEDALLLEKVWAPLRTFLLQHTRESDLKLFMDIAQIKSLEEDTKKDIQEEGWPDDPSAIPWYCIVPSFCISELRIAFMIGFLLFLPFLVIDMVIAAILMSMGMIMLPPAMISMPFKILLFIIVDGWHLIIQQMVNGY